MAAVVKHLGEEKTGCDDWPVLFGFLFKRKAIDHGPKSCAKRKNPINKAATKKNSPDRQD